MCKNAFLSIINKPTRISDTAATVLDQMWTTTQLTHWLTVFLFYFVLILQTSSYNQKSYIKNQSFFEASQLLFQNKLSGLDISALLQNKDINKDFNMFITVFIQIFNEYFPLLPVQTKTLNNQWYDDKLKELRKIRNRN